MYTYSKNGPYTGRILRVLIDPIIAMLKKIAFASAGLLLLASPLLASAATLSELQAQLAALTAQINQMLAQSGTTATLDETSAAANTASCPNLTIDMRLRARDATTNGQVTDLQTFLADYYNLPEAGLVTGYF